LLFIVSKGKIINLQIIPSFQFQLLSVFCARVRAKNRFKPKSGRYTWPILRLWARAGFKVLKHGSLNVPIEHHPTIRYMVYNDYYKVMSNIPKMGQLPTPVKTRAFWPIFKIAFLFAAARAENRRLKSSFVDFWAAPPPRPLNIESAVFGVSLAYNFEILGLQKGFALVFGAVGPKRLDRAKLAQAQRGDQKRVFKILREFRLVSSASTAPRGGSKEGYLLYKPFRAFTMSLNMTKTDLNGTETTTWYRKLRHYQLRT